MIITRIKVTLKIEKGSVIPFDYQYYLASMVYRVLEKVNKEYAFEIHKPKKYKHYTFSYLMCNKRAISDKGLVFLDDEISFFFSSPNRKMVADFVNGLLLSQEVKICRLKGIISEIKVLGKKDIKNKCVLGTLTPIVVRKPVCSRKGVKGIELDPKNPEFFERLKNNLLNRFNDFYDEDVEEKEINFKLLAEPKQKRHKIKTEYYRCYFLPRFEITGDPKIIEYGYEAGLGEKNAMGFGMVKMI